MSTASARSIYGGGPTTRMDGAHVAGMSTRLPLPLPRCRWRDGSVAGSLAAAASSAAFDVLRYRNLDYENITESARMVRPILPVTCLLLSSSSSTVTRPVCSKEGPVPIHQQREEKSSNPNL
ncbi:hypothetical protein AXG93_4031s1250 [Marchantia polymorpha subsp. ruderalis]|uniref:Uncharacterized protein n=1 Tax=Marchantia polymorpha subsp. ruderalis TaxID=1480154 RepID=A0A176WDT5_MARPO|nr:hypothetical protein AXG93_4031s1250 [Marchantia polymorpha subsp. ruderalis]